MQTKKNSVTIPLLLLFQDFYFIIFCLTVSVSIVTLGLVSLYGYSSHTCSSLSCYSVYLYPCVSVCSCRLLSLYLNVKLMSLLCCLCHLVWIIAIGSWFGLPLCNAFLKKDCLLNILTSPCPCYTRDRMTNQPLVWLQLQNTSPSLLRMIVPSRNILVRFWTLLIRLTTMTVL